MKTSKIGASVCTLVCALAFGALTSAALAEEPIQLTDVQMDTLTAGQAIASATNEATIGGSGSVVQNATAIASHCTPPTAGGCVQVPSVTQFNCPGDCVVFTGFNAAPTPF
jgi:hypothetical protein